MDDAVSLANQYAQGHTDPVQELERVFQAIDANQHVFISTCPERAFREAKAAKARWQAGMPLSLFDGVPIAWKDLFDLKGMITTAGAKIRKNIAAAQNDAALVGNLTRMGIVNVGKTNLTEFAYSGLGLNPHFGTPANSIDPLCIPGGSSSGAAVSVGKHIVPISIGTDTAGSIRIPSAFNGLVGYRSSAARYSKQGVFPLAQSLDTLGPLARSVRDCIVLDQLILGQAAKKAPIASQEQSIRIYADLTILDDPDIQDDVKQGFLHTLDQLKQADVQICHQKIEAFQQAQALIQAGKWLGAAEAYTLHEALLSSPDAEELDPRVRKRLLSAKDILASTQVRLYQAASQLKAQLRQELAHGFFISPSVAHTPPKLEPLQHDDELFNQTNLKTLKLTMPGSFLDMPGVALPTSSAGVFPLSVLLSSYSGNDLQLLSAALRVEQILNPQ